MQAVVYGVVAAVGEVEEPADFGEAERYEASMDGWRGVWFGRFVGWGVGLA
ncbi:MAG: hypothetical protein M3Y73_07355 [Actinomycetota bacterium]|nr:hypothetical protein [Actinomycetota bacterium]